MSNPELALTDLTSCAPTRLLRTPLTAKAAESFATTLRALADPVRLRLLSAVASHDGQRACVCDVSAGIDVSQPTISHHLKVLREAGLLVSERQGSWVYYQVNPTALQHLSELFNTSDVLVGGL